MAKAKQLTKRQLAVLADLFAGELNEQAVLDRHKVSSKLYNRWLADEQFADEFDRRIASAYRQSEFIIARYAPLAAAKLVQLTESDKDETARKACLDILSQIANGKSQIANADSRQAIPVAELSDLPTEQLPPQTVSRLLAALAEEKEQ